MDWQIPGLALGSTVKGTDVEVVPVFQDSGKKLAVPSGPYAAMLEKLRKSHSFSAAPGHCQFVRFGGKNGSDDVLFLGMGIAAELTEERVRNAGGNAWAKLVHEKSKKIAIAGDYLVEAKGLKSETPRSQWATALAEGLLFGAYQYQRFRQKESHVSFPVSVTWVMAGGAKKSLRQELEKSFAWVSAAAESMRVTRDWSNEPSNIGTPEFFAGEAKKWASKHGIKCRILGEKECARQKMNLFLGVGQGSVRENKLVVLEYLPKGTKKGKTVALVGKGITFDSGGISIKPSLRMEEMKHDMTGAATVMGAILLAARMKSPNRVVAILAFAENMPSGDAIQPGNVIRSRSGKTVEIVNTDAEGRLILADALDFAHEFKPDVVLDVATLTGAVSIALGKYYCGVLGNDDPLIEEIKRCGERSGERLWQLPLIDDYFDDMKSEWADMRNSANDGNGGTIRGAIFLKQFIRKGVKWAHLDIASSCYNVGHMAYMPKRGATGGYVRTLARFAMEY